MEGRRFTPSRGTVVRIQCISLVGAILRGDGYREFGRLQKAEDWYIGAWKHPVAHERFGQFYEEMGGHGYVRAVNERFVAAWKNADPKLQARVTMAQKRLDALGEKKTAE